MRTAATSRTGRARTIKAGAAKVGAGSASHCSKKGGRDLLEAGGAEKGDLLTGLELGEELLDGLLAGDGFGVGGRGEQVADEAVLAEAGADGAEQGEKRVGAEEVEVVLVEVVGGAVREGFGGGGGAGDTSLGAGVVVEDALGAGDLGLGAEREGDEGGDGGEGGEQGPGGAGVVERIKR